MANAIGDRVRDRGVLGGAHSAQRLHRSGHALEYLSACRAPGQVAIDAAAGDRSQILIGTPGELAVRLRARRDERMPKDVHVTLDASRTRTDSTTFATCPLSVRRRTIGAVSSELSDESVIASAREGDVEAFTVLVRRHERRLRAVLNRLLDDPRDVEEALQDTFVAAWRGLAMFRADAMVTTWLHRIGVNEALMRLRRPRRNAETLGDSAQDPGPGPAELSEKAELGRFLANRLRGLPSEQRVPLVLRDVAGFSNQEVAEVLDLSLAAVKSRVHRGRLWLVDEVAAWEQGRTPHA